jgi:hypothetical protein
VVDVNKVKDIRLKIKNVLTKFEVKRIKQCGHIYTVCHEVPIAWHLISFEDTEVYGSVC